jgi:hypothetical protein
MQASARTLTAGAAAGVALAAALLPAESGAEAAVQRPGMTLAGALATGGARSALTLPLPFGTGIMARLGKKDLF